jgi:trk system potassium uptake protein TrkA
MFVIIAGGGRTGTQLALELLEQNYKVHIIENRPAVLQSLHRELPTELIFEGPPAHPDTLLFAGIEKANVLAAVTANDADNLGICYIARKMFNVGRTIARINNPRNAWLFTEIFHVDIALNQSAIFASLIEEEMSLGDMITLLKLRRGNFSLVEEKIPSAAPALGVAIKDLDLPESCVIAAIIREGKVIVPRGITTFEIDDEVLAVTDRAGADKLAILFSTAGKLENQDLNVDEGTNVD